MNMKKSIQDELAPIILAVVAQIPYGCVASYGQVARLAGLAQHARLVGRVLQCIDQDSDLPWHRVVNAQGNICTKNLSNGENLQVLLLAREGIVVNQQRVNMRQYRWQM